jgi:conjugal transfer ATP-binding protein TraC
MAREGAGQVILNSSAWKILLAQKAEEVDQLFSSGTLKQWAEDDFYRRSVKDLETRKGVYSELLISGDRYYETVRLYVDKFTGALFSSEGDARDAVFQLMRGGMSAVDAVLQIMGDKRVSHLAQIKRTVQFLRDLDPNLSPAEIMSMTHEAVHA